VAFFIGSQFIYTGSDILYSLCITIILKIE